MIDFEKMEVGDTLPLSTKTIWEDPENRGEYQRAQEHTQKTGMLFSIDTIHKDMPAGRKIAGFMITRTK